MSLARARRGRYQANYWPGFVDMLSTLLLVVTLFVASLSLRTGRTNILLGLVHIVMFAAYLFLSFVP